MEPDTARRFVIERLASEIEIDMTRRQFAGTCEATGLTPR